MKLNLFLCTSGLTPEAGENKLALESPVESKGKGIQARRNSARELGFLPTRAAQALVTACPHVHAELEPGAQLQLAEEFTCANVEPDGEYFCNAVLEASKLAQSCFEIDRAFT